MPLVLDGRDVKTAKLVQQGTLSKACQRTHNTRCFLSRESAASKEENNGRMSGPEAKLVVQENGVLFKVFRG